MVEAEEDDNGMEDKEYEQEKPRKELSMYY